MKLKDVVDAAKLIQARALLQAQANAIECEECTITFGKLEVQLHKDFRENVKRKVLLELHAQMNMLSEQIALFGVESE